MTLLFCDGFSHYAAGDLAEKYSTVDDTDGAFSIVSGGGAHSGDALRMTGDAGANVAKIQVSNAALQSWVCGFHFKISQVPSSAIAIFALSEDGVAIQMNLRVNADGTLDCTRAGTQVAGGTSVNTLAADTWYWLEWKVTISNSISANTCVVTIDGVEWINVDAGEDCQNTAVNNANLVEIGKINAASKDTTVDFDNLYLANTLGSRNNAPFGQEMRVDLMLPNGPGSNTDWTPSAGDNYAAVDEVPPDNDTVYVSSDTANHVDTYKLENFTEKPSLIAAVQGVVSAKYSGAGGNNLTPVVRSGGTNYNGASNALTSAYTFYREIWETDPDTSAEWTRNGIDVSEFGAKHDDSISEARATQAVLEVLRSVAAVSPSAVAARPSMIVLGEI